MATNRVKAIEMYAHNSATLTGGYDPFVASLDQACFMLRIINASNKQVNISYDGTTMHDVVLSNSTTMLMFQTNNLPHSGIALMPKGKGIWLVGDPGVGWIYLAGYYVE